MVLTFQHATFSILCTHGGGCIHTFHVIVFLTAWECPFTAAIELEDKRRASVWTPFLGPSSCGASSVVPKEGCLVVQGAAEWCCRLKSTPDDQYPEPPACRIGTAASSDIFHLSFRLSLHCLEVLVASQTMTCPLSLRNEVFRWNAVCVIPLYTRGSSAMPSKLGRQGYVRSLIALRILCNPVLPVS